MSARENATLVRTMVNAFLTGDLETVGTSFAPDAVWELPSRGRLAGEYRGPEAITVSWRRPSSSLAALSAWS